MLYNGKELQMIAQIDFLDYNSRQYNPTISKWMILDPLADKNSSISAYNYCIGNPISYIDPMGEDVYQYTDTNGVSRTIWLNSQAKVYKDKEGRIWQNIGENILYTEGNYAVLYTQRRNSNGSLTQIESKYDFTNPQEVSALYTEIKKILDTGSEIAGFWGSAIEGSKVSFHLNKNSNIVFTWRGLDKIGSTAKNISNILGIASAAISLNQIHYSEKTIEKVGHGVDAVLTIGSMLSNYVYIINLYYQNIMKNYPAINQGVNNQINERAEMIKKGYPSVGHPGFPFK